MNEIKKTSRNRFTRMCIGEAVIALMNEKNFNDIKISDIAAKAGVSRMTYYHYYDSKTDILRDYLQEIVASYLKKVGIFSSAKRKYQKKDTGAFQSYTHILHSLLFFDQYASFFLTLTNAGLYSIIIDAINDFMTAQVLPDYQGSAYELYYYSGALLNTFIQWESDGKKESAEEIAKIISSFVS